MTKKLGLFEAYGIELEYMIVDRKTLAPRFICDQVLRDLHGGDTMVHEIGDIAWSNELALHVIEIKCNGPQTDLGKIERSMTKAVSQMNEHLARYDARLLATAMHPFFDPNDGSLKLWSGEDHEIYSTYDRIFSCKGHGWGNLQSIHINLPFANDEEFFKLHAAIRLLLPLLPAFAASSPFVEGKRGPLLDSRLHYYLANQRRIPSIIGLGIPEPVTSEADYRECILKPMYADIKAFDPEGELCHEWLNSRAAIARFERSAIEIRILDLQESVRADFALIAGIVGALKQLVARNEPQLQNEVSQESLRRILDGVLQEQGDYVIGDALFLRELRHSAGPLTAREALGLLFGHVPGGSLPPFAEKNLAERMITKLGDTPSRDELCGLYQALGRCLDDNSFFN